MADPYVKVVINTDQVVETVLDYFRERIEPLVLAVRAEGHRPANAHTGCEICSALALVVDRPEGGSDA